MAEIELISKEEGGEDLSEVAQVDGSARSKENGHAGRGGGRGGRGGGGVPCMNVARLDLGPVCYRA
eukprot:768737-Hanusia_phi.AAC.1